MSNAAFFLPAGGDINLAAILGVAKNEVRGLFEAVKLVFLFKGAFSLTLENS